MSKNPLDIFNDYENITIDTVNMSNPGSKKKTGFFSANSRNILFVAGAVSLIVCLGLVFIKYKKKLDKEEFYKEYFSSSLIEYENRNRGYSVDDLSLYEYAISCCLQENYKEAIPIFEGLLESKVYLKEACMWNLAGCYIVTGKQEDKATRLLVQVAEMNGSFSSLAKEVVKKKGK